MMKNILDRCPLIPVLTVNSVQDGYFKTKILSDLGWEVIEITLRTKAALSTIKELSKEFPHIKFGAGTVTTVSILEDAYGSGASFAVSPGFNPAMVSMANIYGFPYMPGIATTSEAMQAFDLGINVMKCFPVVALGGLSYLKALHTVLPDIYFCPTGGINHNNYKDYLALPFVPSVGLSALMPDELVVKNDAAGIKNHIQSFMGEKQEAVS